ncbi:MAG: glycoside hydrolase family 2 TIM barrel-domain containing protein [Pseudomonadota bacterium]|nr:glycoside hydrolase family 2 TIM barrel-domain containing protein [Pseudomonadota bacterium]
MAFRFCSYILLTLCLVHANFIFAQAESAEDFFSQKPPEYAKPSNLIGWIDNREYLSLNGQWKYIVDPMNNGLPETSFFGGFPENKTQKDGYELIEYNFDQADVINVPGAWNEQKDELFFYQGSIWLFKKFNFNIDPNKLNHLYIGASNFSTKIFLNGERVGQFNSGYTAFNFDISDYLINGENVLLVQINANLSENSVPTKKTDWWPYGGLVGDVLIVNTPKIFIENAYVQISDLQKKQLNFRAKLNLNKNMNIKLIIDELNLQRSFTTNKNGEIDEFIKFKNIDLWSPENPKLYNVTVKIEGDEIVDQIGFREIKTKGKQIFLNGTPIKFKGISMHAEPIGEKGVAFSRAHFESLVTTSKELNINFIRAAHYPYTRHMAKVCDELGIMLWEEIPVYWNINWTNKQTKEDALNMLSNLVTRDWNRASVVVWSLGNETPFSKDRMTFMNDLKDRLGELDVSRLKSAAILSGDAQTFSKLISIIAKVGLEKKDLTAKERYIFEEIVKNVPVPVEKLLPFEININDPLANELDLIAYNEYFGWYYTSFFSAQIGIRESLLREIMFELMPSFIIRSEFNKPIHISEFGAGAKHSFKKTNQVWSEEYQAKVYLKQLEMLKSNPQVQGISPWILKDFRSMMRPLDNVQDFYNRKGLIDENGNKKQAFSVLSNFYENEW